MWALTGDLGQSELIVNTESKLKISEKRTRLEHEKSLKQDMVSVTRLLDLPYYDAIQMSTIVDPLHNIWVQQSMF